VNTCCHPSRRSSGASAGSSADWAGYSQHGNSVESCDTITLHAINPLSIFIANRYRCDRRFGWWFVARQSPGELGPIDLDGIVIPPPRPPAVAPGHADCGR